MGQYGSKKSQFSSQWSLQNYVWGFRNFKFLIVIQKFQVQHIVPYRKTKNLIICKTRDPRVKQGNLQTRGLGY